MFGKVSPGSFLKDWGCRSVEKHLPRKHEALEFVPSPGIEKRMPGHGGPCLLPQHSGPGEGRST